MLQKCINENSRLRFNPGLVLIMLLVVYRVHVVLIRLARFSTETILAEELCKITEALEAKDVDQKSLFLKG